MAAPSLPWSLRERREAPPWRGAGRAGTTAVPCAGVVPCCKDEVLHRAVGKDGFFREVCLSRDLVGFFDGQAPLEEEQRLSETTKMGEHMIQ